jgi:hypothetical protein
MSSMESDRQEGAAPEAPDGAVETGLPGAGAPGGPRLSGGEADQAHRAVMHPEADDPEWRYYFGAWHS